jgi:glycerol-3-phosphate acyltransferase PlsY
MSIEVLLLFGLTGYLVGSFSFARLFVRIFAPDFDLKNLKTKAEGGEEMKMLTSGANAVSLVIGPKLSMLVSILDILKVALPMLALKVFYGGDLTYLVFSIAALLGNNWPIYYSFKGGTGFSVAIGSVAVVDVVAAVAAPVLGLFAGVFIFANIGIANLGWLVFLVPLLWLRTSNVAVIIFTIILDIVILIALWPEARRFMQYSRQGRLKGLAESYYNSSAMARGMKRIFDWRNNLGKWRYPIAILSAMALFTFFYVVYVLGKP